MIEGGRGRGRKEEGGEKEKRRYVFTVRLIYRWPVAKSIDDPSRHKEQ